MARADVGAPGQGWPVTRFASPWRASPEVLAADLARAASSPVVEALLRSFGSAVFVLNEHRQILAANTASLEMLGVTDASGLLGLRPGEAVGCVHSAEEPGGCGTARACATCGAVLSILVATKHLRPEERDCALTIRHHGSTIDLDLRVRAVPMRLEGHDLLLVALSDVSQQSRHASMERAFLHDVSNVLTGLVIAADALGSPDLQEAAEAAIDVRAISDRLVREVRIQRMLSTSVLDDYPVSIQPVHVPRLFEDLARLFNRVPAAANHVLEVEPPEVRVVSTDPFLLARILTNMLKNAFEATPPGSQVRLSARAVEDGVRFEVHNPGAIPAAVVPRIFQRHFTTKAGAGHGEGTWSMRTLGEQLLHGSVGFDTDRVTGTTFWFRLPQAARPAA